MIEALDAVAMAIGYILLTVAFVYVTVWTIFKYTYRQAVSDEARELAKQVDPNTGFGGAANGVIAEGFLAAMRDLQPNETIRSDPRPIMKFDWSVDAPRQEEVEAIFNTLHRAGYYSHPFPDINHYQDRYTWHKEIAGIWRHEPEWYIVELDEETGREVSREKVDLPLSPEWRIFATPS